MSGSSGNGGNGSGDSLERLLRESPGGESILRILFGKGREEREEREERERRAERDSAELGVAVLKELQALHHELELIRRFLRRTEEFTVKYSSGVVTLTEKTDASDLRPPPESNYTYLKVNDVLKRNADLTLLNLGMGNIYALYSHDGVSFTTSEELIEPNGYTVFTNVHTLAVRTNRANTQFKAVEAMLIPGSTNIVRSERICTVETDASVHFTEELKQNCWEKENLTEDIDGNPISNKIMIRDVNIQSTVNCHFRLWFFSRDTFCDTGTDADALNNDSFVDFVDLDLPTLGARADDDCDGTLDTHYYLQIRGLELLYEDEDGTNEIHVALQNLSTTTKPAGANVQIDIRFSDRL